MQTKVSNIIQLVHVSKCLHLYWPWKPSLATPNLLWDLGRGLPNFVIAHLWNIFSSRLQRNQRVKASPPHLHLPANPDLSNHCTLTYWLPCWGNSGSSSQFPHDFLGEQPRATYSHGIALRPSRRLLWLVFLDFSPCQSPPARSWAIRKAPFIRPP